jgi:CheY-like chemotaxis protein
MEAEQKKILLVDDDAFLVGIYTKQAEVAGIELKTALGGEEAIALLEGGFDAAVVALDMSMAGMTGLDMLKIIKEKNLAPGAKLVVLSNTTDDNTVAEAKALGADSFIVKASILPSEVITELVKVARGE